MLLCYHEPSNDDLPRLGSCRGGHILVSEEQQMSFNTNRFTEKSIEAINATQNLAERNGNSQVEPEHLLLALCDQSDGVVPQVLEKLNLAVGVVIQQIRAELGKLPRVSGSGVQVGISNRLRTVLLRAHDEL